MARYEITAPDGTKWEVTAPDGASQDEVLKYAQENWKAPGRAVDPVANTKKVARGIATAVAGGINTAGNIGATILAPKDYAEDAIERAFGLPGKNRNEQRRADIKNALASMGADPESGAWMGGGILTGIAGTAGIGPVVAAAGAPVLPAALTAALATSGGSAGGALGLAGQAARIGGGATVGALSAGLVNPEDAAMGAAIGGAAPVVLKAAGEGGKLIGKAVSSVTKGAEARAGARLAKALDAEDVQAVAARLARAQEMVPGSAPNVNQVLRTPQSGILQRVVQDSPGGGALRDQLAAQNAARLAALEKVAPTDPLGFANARQDFGEAAGRYIRAGDAAAKARTSAAFNAVPQDEAMVYLPDLARVRDRFYSAASFGDRNAVDDAVAAAQRVGTVQLPAVRQAAQGSTETLATAVRKAGGLSVSNNSGLRGELQGLKGDLKNLIRTNGGMSPDRMAQKMFEAGYLPDDDAATLIAALRDQATGSRGISTADDLAGFRRAAESAMGDAPVAGAVPKKVTLRELQDLRSSIGTASRQARIQGNDKGALALDEMKRAIDDRVNEVVRGDGAIDEVLPIDWANKLDEARRLKVDQVQKFRTGPQADLFRRGADGQPMVQGGEVAAKFWGNRPGLADDVKSLRKVIDENPQLLGQFRGMVTTEGAGTATAGGNLSIKFARWVESRLPGLREAFDPEQVKVLQRIAADVKRAEAAAAAGMSRGSNTYQNAANALNLGLLDNGMVDSVAGKVPFGSSGVEWLRGTLRERRAAELARLLSDPRAAANALQAAGQQTDPALVNLLMNPDLQQIVLRSAPGAYAGR